MKHAWTLTLINAALAIALGLGFVLVPERVLDFLPFLEAPSASAIALLRLLGALICGLGLMLWILPPLKLSSPRRMLLTTVHSALAFVWIYLPLASRERPYGIELTVDIALHASSLFLFLGLLSFVYRFGETGPASEEPAADSESAAQQERNRLARDLHDSIKQQLFSIKLSSAAAEERWENDPQAARAALADVRRSSQEAMVEMRALLAQLRPEPLATAGLVEALREQCEALGYRCGIPVDFEIGDLPPDNRLPAPTQESLFRIAQESLSNIAHHSRARSAQVRLGQVDQDGSPALLLRVRDDGQGFDPASRPAGMGLRNMRERLEAAGGTLDVESAPGQGTEVRARMPLTPPKALVETTEKVALWTAMSLAFVLTAGGRRLIVPLLMLYFMAALGRTMKQAVAAAGKDSALGIGFRLTGHQHRFIQLALIFWGTCLESSFSGVLRFAAILVLGLALREAWSLFRLLRSLDGPPPGPVLPRWLFAVLLLVFLASLPALLLVPDPEIVTRSGAIVYAILYLGWWMKTLP